MRATASYVLVGILMVLAVFWPLSGSSIFGKIERLGASVARRKHLAIASIALAAILLRLSLLWISPVPVPGYHDEFSYLLAADTFAHGRLTNPPHPMSVYLDTFQINQHPTYMSKYPPAQGLVLALGQRLGHPWIGVLLSMAAMIGAIVWALQGWLPPQWALLGGILALLRLGLFGYWINSYWGGALAALGGALVIGALPRIVRFARSRDAAILALGEMILAMSRPLEGLIFSIPLLAVLLIWILRKWKSFAPGALVRLAVPFCGIVSIFLMFTAYYNWRVAGSPLLTPYSVNDHAYLAATPIFLWQKPATLIHFRNPQFEEFYNGANRDSWTNGRADSVRKAFSVLGRDVREFGRFFIWPELCLPLIASFWVLRDRRVRFLLTQVAICFLGYLLPAWFFPHYAAPIVAPVFALLIQGLRHIRTWEFWGRPVGIGITRAFVLSVLILAPLHPVEYQQRRSGNRAPVEARLEKMPGKQLVIVHYSPHHYVHAEWVFNRADIDNAKVVWAREIPGVDAAPLLAYFKDRRVWTVDADSRSPEPVPYGHCLDASRAGMP